uniref:Kelch-like protein diablo n=2 Tax=Cacopsylla melanoneura TaxID=428564 RepID=A0A8D9A839_9HEMI
MAEVATDWNLGPGRPLHCTSFESPLHTSILLSGLSKLKSKNLLLDVTLIAEGEAFQAHKVVLASISDYFRAMFTDAMRESKQSEICLNGITARGMKLLLEYAYSSRVELNLDNIQHVLLSASHVQIEPLVEACSSYLQSQLDLDNCVDLATIAETYSLTKLRVQVYRFMCSHLRSFSSSGELFRLSLSQLEHLFACDFPVDMCETDVLDLGVQWLRTQISQNKLVSKQLSGACERIFSLIHFAHIDPAASTDLVNDPLLQQHPGCAKALYGEMKKQRDASSAVSIVNSPLLNSRGMELAIVKVGGFSLSGITNEITYYLPSVGKWKRLTSIPHVEQCNFGTAVLDNKLYVVGGCFNQALQEIIHPFGFIYNPMNNKWTTMSPLQRERCRFSLNVLGGRLIAIGGDSELVWSDEEDCELYDPRLDQWVPLGSPRHSLPVQHAGASTSTGLYVSGGLYREREQVCPSMWRFDLTSVRWERKACMPTPRADHVLVPIAEKIYACGGWYEDADSMNRIIVDTIDMYSIEEDLWSTVTRIPTPRLHAGIVGVANKIYFIGGFLGDAMYDRGTARIECYDTETDSWSIYDNYPQEVWEHTCVTLYIPRCRDDMQVLRQ